MTPTPRLTFQKGDFFAILLVILLTVGIAAAFIPWNASSEDAVVQIWQDGTLIHEYPLTAEETIHLSGDYKNTVVIHSGHVAITESDCPVQTASTADRSTGPAEALSVCQTVWKSALSVHPT